MITIYEEQFRNHNVAVYCYEYKIVNILVPHYRVQ